MTTAIDRSGSRPEQRGRPNLDRDEQRTGGAAAHAASSAGRTAEDAANDPAQMADERRRPADETSHRDEARNSGGTVGEHLPPVPRAMRPALAAGRERARALEAFASPVGVAGAVSLVAIAMVILLLLARSRRRSPAEELMARLETVSDRISTARA